MDARQSRGEPEELDNSDLKTCFAPEVYELLKDITKIRNHCIRKCFKDWVYEPDSTRDALLTKSARRMLKNHNRLAILFRAVEAIRVKLYSGS